MIILFTDFGLEGPYTGQVEAVLHEQAPAVPVIHLFSDLPPFDIQAAAYLLPAFTSRFPPGTVFLCVVDPGVGSERPGVVVKIAGQWFVGPNEGLFALLARRAQAVECWQLPVRDEASPSFHGRDVFAPAAARLARGLAPPGDAVDAATLERPDWPDDLLRIVYIDRFGNAMTGARAGSPDRVLTVNGHALKSARTFADIQGGTAFWYENSNGLVEIAVNRGRADELLELAVGTRIG
ncbi:MAG: SAM-dependent chlorinase/fluorinase [Halobacteria archaeon]|nr:SAM-dependent chlorinase/fluorinase [Halobacteria archaeon]